MTCLLSTDCSFGYTAWHAFLSSFSTVGTVQPEPSTLQVDASGAKAFV